MKWFVLKNLYFFSYLVTICPRKVHTIMGQIIGVLWFDVFRIRRKVTIDNVQNSYPEKSMGDVVKIARQSVINLGQSLIDYCVMIHFKKEWLDRFFVLDDISSFHNAFSGGKGVIMLGSHLGSGDFGIMALSVLGYKVNLISKHFKVKWLDDFWFGIREKKGTHFISNEKSTFDILRSLKKNECVIFVLDQYMGPPVGVKTTFFGRPTGTAAGLAIFAQKSGSPVVPMYTYRRDDGRIGIRSDKVIPFDKSSNQGDNIQKMTQVYTTKIEDIVRRHPEQWLWLHRRWKEFNETPPI